MAKGIRTIWIDSDTVGVTGTKVYRDGLLIDTVAQGIQEYKDPNVVSGVEYEYVLQAVTADGESVGEVLGVNKALYTIEETPVTQLTPILTNFRVEDANKDRVYFDTPLGPVTGMTTLGFEITGNTILAVDTVNNYFTVQDAFDSWDNNTIRLGENSDTSDRQTVLHNFTLSSVSNDMPEPTATTNRYVAVGGSGDGTSEGSAASLTYMAANASAGQTWWIKAGGYGDTRITLGNNGTVDNPIKYIGYKNTIGDITTNYFDYGVTMSSSEMPTLTGPGPASLDYNDIAISITGNYFILRNIQTYGYGRSLYAGASYSNHFIIDRFNIEDNYSPTDVSCTGMHIVVGSGGHQYFRILDSTIINCTMVGIAISGPDAKHILIDGVKSYCDRTDSIERQDYHISLKGDQNIIRNCYAENFNNTSTSGSTHGIGVLAGQTGNATYNLIEESTAINFNECLFVRNSLVEYNVIKNSFAGNNGNTSDMGDTGGLYIFGEANYNTFENCKVVGVGTGLQTIDKNTEDGNSSTDIGDGNKFINCIFDDIYGNGIELAGNTEGASPDSIFSNTDFINCTWNNLRNFISNNTTYTVDIQGMYFKNNILNDVRHDTYGVDSLDRLTFTDSTFYASDSYFTSLVGSNGNIDENPQLDANFLPTNESLMEGATAFGGEYDYNKKEREVPKTTIGAVTLTSEDAGGVIPPVTDIDYYVSTSGTGSGVGSEADPLTLSQITSVGLTTDDVMAFKRGDVFVGVTDFNLLSGVTFTAYGTGALPVLTSIIEYNLNWTDQGGNVWQTTDVDRQVKRMKIDGVEVLSAGSLGELGTNIPDLATFYWSGSSLSVYSTDSPANHTLEFSSHLTAGGTYYNHTLGFTNSSDITINNISFQGGYFETVKFSNQAGVTMTDCDLGDMCFNGIIVEGASSNIVIQNNDLDSKFTLDYSGAGVGALSSRGAADCVRFQQCNVADVSNNTFVNWQHTSVSMTSQSQEIITGVKVYLNDCSIPNLPYGGSITTDGLNVHTNEIYNNTLDGVKGVQFNGHDNHFHDNIVKNSKQSTIHSYTTGEGLGMQNYYEGCYNNIVEDNTFENCDDAGVFVSGNNYGGDVTGNIVRRNDFINCGSGGTNKGIRIDTDASTGSNYGNSYIDNNIYNDSETLTVRYRNTDMTVAAFNSSTGSPENNTISGNTANAGPGTGIDYYVSFTDGSDSDDGLTEGTAWKTLYHIYEERASITPGKVVALKKGDVWNERLLLSSSMNGTLGNEIVITSYGSDSAKPKISQTESISTWTDQGGNIWRADVSGTTIYHVLKDDELQTNARFPIITSDFDTEANYSNIDTVTDQTHLIVSDFAGFGTNALIGAYVYILTSEWILEQGEITAYNTSTGAITVSGFTGTISVGEEIFINNNINLLATQDDWHYDSINEYLYIYSTTSPTNITAITQTTDGCAANSSYVTIDGLEFSGLYGRGVTSESNTGVTIQNSSFKNIWNFAINGYNSIDLTVIDNTFDNSTTRDVTASGTSTGMVVERNTIRNSGLLSQLSYIGYNDGNNKCIAVQVDATIRHNDIENVAYVGIFTSNPAIIEENYIKSTCLAMQDGGAIYTTGTGAGVSGTQINNNICIANPSASDTWNSFGIYLDESSESVTVGENTTTGFKRDIFLHKSKDNTITYNSMYKSKSLGFTTSEKATGFPVENNDINNNDIYLEVAGGYALNIYSETNSYAIGTVNNNNYWNPLSTDDVHVKTTEPRDEGLTLAEWVALSGQDTTSTSDLGTTFTDSQLVYNATNSQVVEPLVGTWTDLSGNSYIGSITLEAWSGKILIQTTGSSELEIPTGITLTNK